MGDMLSMLLECGREDKLLTKKQILYIVDYFKEYFNIDVDVEFKSIPISYMYYDNKNNIIRIDYDKLNINNHIYSNYRTIFSIIHEMRHIMQLKYIEEHKDNLSRIFFSCNVEIGLLGLYDDNKFYHEHHDYFPIEINANMVASYYLMIITGILGDNIYYNIFKNSLETELERLKSVEYKKVLEYLGCDDITDEDELIPYYEEFIRDNDVKKDEGGLITYC